MLFDEAARIEELHEFDVLDSEPEASFDDIARIASAVCQTPISAISLIDVDRQWFKARVGLEPTETPRDVAFCAHAIRQEGLFVVPDAHEDPRFADNPLVRSTPNIRFYAGAPLVTSAGHALGTLCVIDSAPRRLTPDQEVTLGALARQVMVELELRRKVRELAEARRELAVLASTDPLTGLANRREFVRRLDTAFERARRDDRLVGLVSIDLDLFKQVNDTQGHDAGDELLVRVADALKLELRLVDTAARLGGDEFAIIFEAVHSVLEMEAIAGRIRLNLGDVHPASVGHAAVEFGEGPAKLLREADAAMYADKAARQAERTTSG